MCTFLPSQARAEDRLCDPGAENCRQILLNYIANEQVGIDVAFWFMEDARYTSALSAKAKAGVPVRVLMDTRANATNIHNAARLDELKNAGIPMRERYVTGILHWKMMLFAGQNVVEFSGANYSGDAWLPSPGTPPYSNYVDESILFTDDSEIVNSFRTKYDDLWTDTTSYRNYANITAPLVRKYGTFPISSELNFPPGPSYSNRAVGRYNAETQKIDVIMYRITDRRHTDAIIAAHQRGVPIRLITEPQQYRDETRLWHSWNIDRLFVAGIPIKHRAHAGLNHQKSVLLYGQGLTIFGSSNWTSPSANSQQEHNYFTTKPHIFQWFVDQFERKWNNTGGVVENTDFAPLPPDAPKTPSPANVAVEVATLAKLSWFGGPWAHLYDVYLGTSPNPPLVAENLELGPSESATQRQTFTPAQPLVPGTTYYWRVVGKTMAGLGKSSATYSFTTAGTAPPPDTNGTLGPGDILLHAFKASRSGAWVLASDSTAASGNAVRHPDAAATKLAAPLQSPTDYIEMSFPAEAGKGYRIWIRGKAQGNSWANDSVFVQFSESVTSTGTPQWRIGTTQATTISIEDCNGCGVSNWGWQDNAYGTGALGPLVYFANNGPQTIRIQTREDGLSIDQIMLSPATFLSSAPGALKNDATIYPESGSGPQPPTVTVVRQPYLQRVTSSTATIAWTTRQAGPAEVKVTGPAGASTFQASSTFFSNAVTNTGGDYYQHVADVTDLVANTQYTYDILVGGVDANPGTDRFTSAPSPSGTVHFKAIGDSGTGSTEQRAIAAKMAEGPKGIILHAGDIAYGNSGGTGDGTYKTLEDWFFSIYSALLRAEPVFPAMGNHDSRAGTANGKHYLDAFVLPENGADPSFPDHAERYYSFDYGAAHFVVLDTELAFQDPARRAAQLAWLDADLAGADRPWKIALLHRAPYSAGGEHGSDLEVRNAFGPIFEQRGVHLVISAHEHDYERTHQINGVTYVVTGGGGAPLYPAGTASWTARSFSTHHFLRGDVDDCTLSFEAVSATGTALDQYSLSRCVVPDLDKPEVNITAPAGGPVQGNVTVEVSATDEGSGVGRVELLVDDVVVGEDTSAPYAFVWDSTTVADGTHRLRARATDGAGNVGLSAEVTVTAGTPSTGDPQDIVLYATDATVVAGKWKREADATAAGGTRVRHPNQSAAKRSTALAQPADYFELTFTAVANVPYRLWVRGKADSNNWANDSVFVQFSSVTAYPIGTTLATEVNLEDCGSCGVAGWGWQDNGYGANVLGPTITFNTSGPQTIRIQTREDGYAIDQIVLSPARFLTASPGALKNDTVILPKTPSP